MVCSPKCGEGKRINYFLNICEKCSVQDCAQCQDDIALCSKCNDNFLLTNNQCIYQGQEDLVFERYLSILLKDKVCKGQSNTQKGINDDQDNNQNKLNEQQICYDDLITCPVINNQLNNEDQFYLNSLVDEVNQRLYLFTQYKIQTYNYPQLNLLFEGKNILPNMLINSCGFVNSDQAYFYCSYGQNIIVKYKRDSLLGTIQYQFQGKAVFINYLGSILLNWQSGRIPTIGQTFIKVLDINNNSTQTISLPAGKLYRYLELKTPIFIFLAANNIIVIGVYQIKKLETYLSLLAKLQICPYYHLNFKQFQPVLRWKNFNLIFNRTEYIVQSYYFTDGCLFYIVSQGLMQVYCLKQASQQQDQQQVPNQFDFSNTLISQSLWDFSGIFLHDIIYKFPELIVVNQQEVLVINLLSYNNTQQNQTMNNTISKADILKNFLSFPTYEIINQIGYVNVINQSKVVGSHFIIKVQDLENTEMKRVFKFLIIIESFNIKAIYLQGNKSYSQSVVRLRNDLGAVLDSSYIQQLQIVILWYTQIFQIIDSISLNLIYQSQMYDIQGITQPNSFRILLSSNYKYLTIIMIDQTNQNALFTFLQFDQSNQEPDELKQFYINYNSIYIENQKIALIYNTNLIYTYDIETQTEKTKIVIQDQLIQNQTLLTLSPSTQLIGSYFNSTFYFQRLDNSNQTFSYKLKKQLSVQNFIIMQRYSYQSLLIVLTDTEIVLFSWYKDDEQDLILDFQQEQIMSCIGKKEVIYPTDDELATDDSGTIQNFLYVKSDGQLICIVNLQGVEFTLQNRIASKVYINGINILKRQESFDQNEGIKLLKADIIAIKGLSSTYLYSREDEFDNFQLYFYSQISCMSIGFLLNELICKNGGLKESYLFPLYKSPFLIKYNFLDQGDFSYNRKVDHFTYLPHKQLIIMKSSYKKFKSFFLNTKKEINFFQTYDIQFSYFGDYVSQPEQDLFSGYYYDEVTSIFIQLQQNSIVSAYKVSEDGQQFDFMYSFKRSQILCMGLIAKKNYLLFWLPQTKSLICFDFVQGKVIIETQSLANQNDKSKKLIDYNDEYLYFQIYQSVYKFSFKTGEIISHIVMNSIKFNQFVYFSQMYVDPNDNFLILLNQMDIIILKMNTQELEYRRFQSQPEFFNPNIIRQLNLILLIPVSSSITYFFKLPVSDIKASTIQIYKTDVLYSIYTQYVDTKNQIMSILTVDSVIHFIDLSQINETIANDSSQNKQKVNSTEVNDFQLNDQDEEQNSNQFKNQNEYDIDEEDDIPQVNSLKEYLSFSLHELLEDLVNSNGQENPMLYHAQPIIKLLVVNDLLLLSGDSTGVYLWSIEEIIKYKFLDLTMRSLQNLVYNSNYVQQESSFTFYNQEKGQLFIVDKQKAEIQKRIQIQQEVYTQNYYSNNSWQMLNGKQGYFSSNQQSDENNKAILVISLGNDFLFFNQEAQNVGNAVNLSSFKQILGFSNGNIQNFQIIENYLYKNQNEIIVNKFSANMYTSFKNFQGSEVNQQVFLVLESGQIGVIDYRADPFSTTENYEIIQFFDLNNTSTRNIISCMQINSQFIVLLNNLSEILLLQYTPQTDSAGDSKLVIVKTFSLPNIQFNDIEFDAERQRLLVFSSINEFIYLLNYLPYTDDIYPSPEPNVYPFYFISHNICFTYPHLYHFTIDRSSEDSPILNLELYLQSQQGFTRLQLPIDITKIDQSQRLRNLYLAQFPEPNCQRSELYEIKQQVTAQATLSNQEKAKYTTKNYNYIKNLYLSILQTNYKSIQKYTPMTIKIKVQESIKPQSLDIFSSLTNTQDNQILIYSENKMNSTISLNQNTKLNQRQGSSLVFYNLTFLIDSQFQSQSTNFNKTNSFSQQYGNSSVIKILVLHNYHLNQMEHSYFHRFLLNKAGEYQPSSDKQINSLIIQNITNVSIFNLQQIVTYKAFFNKNYLIYSYGVIIAKIQDFYVQNTQNTFFLQGDVLNLPQNEVIVGNQNFTLQNLQIINATYLILPSVDILDYQIPFSSFLKLVCKNVALIQILFKDTKFDSSLMNIQSNLANFNNLNITQFQQSLRYRNPQCIQLQIQNYLEMKQIIYTNNTNLCTNIINSMLVNIQNFNILQNKLVTSQAIYLSVSILYISKITNLRIQNLDLIENYPNFSQKSFLLLDNIQQFIINESEFISNSANNTSGGAITIQNDQDFYDILNSQSQSNITNSKFLNNSSPNNFAGALFINNADMDIKSCQFINNYAQIGGAIRIISANVIPLFYMKHLVQKSIQFQNNTANFYGNNIAFYPKEIRVYRNEQYTPQLTVENFRSGDSLKDIQIKFIDYEDQNVYLQDLSKKSIESVDKLLSYSLEIQADNIFIPNYQLYISQGSRTYSLNATIVSQPLSKEQITISTKQLFPFLVLDKQNQKINITNKQLNTQITIISRLCKKGEIYSKQNEISICEPCPEGKYSFTQPQLDVLETNQCKICPPFAKSCIGDIMKLKNGYWRQNDESDVVYFCEQYQDNCRAEESTSIKYCKQGYVGPLCSSCDIEGKIWGSRYARVSGVYCSSCKLYGIQIGMFIGFLILTVSYLLFLMKQNMSCATKKIQAQYLKILGIIRFGKSAQFERNSILSKILMHYVQIFLIVLNGSQLQIPSIFSILQVGGDPVLNVYYSVDCIIQLFGIQIVFARIIWLIIFVIFLGLAGTFFCFLHYLLNKSQQKQLKYYLSFCSMAIKMVLIYTFPGLLSQITKTITCVTFDKGSYSLADLQFSCDESSYKKISYYFVLPLFFILVLVIPLVYLLRIRRIIKNPLRISLLKSFSFLFYDYKQNAYYWEILKLQLKALIIVSNTLLHSYLFNKLLISLVLIMIYIFIHLRVKPYVMYEFNQLDLMAHLVCNFTIVIILISISSPFESVTYICFSIIVIMNSLYVLRLFKTYFSGIIVQYSQNHRSFIQKLLLVLKRIFPKFFNCINLQKQNSFKILLLWQTLSKHVMNKKEMLKDYKSIISSISQNNLQNEQSSLNNNLIYYNNLKQNISTAKKLHQIDQTSNDYYFNSLIQASKGKGCGVSQNSSFSQMELSMQEPLDHNYPKFQFNKQMVSIYNMNGLILNQDSPTQKINKMFKQIQQNSQSAKNSDSDSDIHQCENKKLASTNVFSNNSVYKVPQSVNQSSNSFQSCSNFLSQKSVDKLNCKQNQTPRSQKKNYIQKTIINNRIKGKKFSLREQEIPKILQNEIQETPKSDNSQQEKIKSFVKQKSFFSIANQEQIKCNIPLQNYCQTQMSVIMSPGQYIKSKTLKDDSFRRQNEYDHNESFYTEKTFQDLKINNQIQQIPLFTNLPNQQKPIEVFNFSNLENSDFKSSKEEKIIKQDESLDSCEIYQVGEESMKKSQNQINNLEKYDKNEQQQQMLDNLSSQEINDNNFKTSTTANANIPKESEKLVGINQIAKLVKSDSQ
ncbi:transmembrane protein, putative (macronuclear) [Tetrahymena thermophila SB210]|uniref:Transmembrane protein, putative n=1 Tax=Tetrahymena thermophila (strain SB210) TaxID=312017 RepID=I7MB92_TETTS|nr:transmembrane protein, putative [Tetrahymena thermophila SB210]EAS07899.2 transmembrane protein, putative [Tetrahymena thermophila SB210]|eukprot:XP_001028141.2 transmembrane protein, putative [Tetrahymena thermophila SB210]